MENELDYSFMRMANKNYEDVRRNSSVSGRTVKAVERPKEIDYAKIAKIVGFALLGVGLVAAIAYFQTKANMQGVTVMGGSGGFTTIANGIDPSFGEVVEEMFNNLGNTFKGGL